MDQDISLIVAMGKNYVIGINNQLPWHLSADLQRFKQLTIGKPVIMGRKTFESLGKPLPGRTNIVITHDEHFRADGCTIVYTLQEAINAAHQERELMIIGGASIYKQAMMLVNKMYVTLVDAALPGDSFFPPWSGDDWKEVSRAEHPADKKNDYAMTFIELQRRR